MVARRKKPAPTQATVELAIALLKARFVLEKATNLSLTPSLAKFLAAAAEDATEALGRHAPDLLAEFDRHQTERAAK
ncbi:hypothetical protein [Caulobacter sp. BP25]|uniref:hypothetical protein n=1 Tax=Caulobacter sp. BP25 TaxID=2048900 RepID=UPI000C12DF8D|nr:hypothetical protein [Caulobacter sp. BP25]PHY20792.1 hypothetical protein CSW59_06095 [Caulobacter sp. BP25]